jgi:hypothetical protein
MRTKFPGTGPLCGTSAQRPAIALNWHN